MPQHNNCKGKGFFTGGLAGMITDACQKKTKTLTYVVYNMGHDENIYMKIHRPMKISSYNGVVGLKT